VHKKVYVNPIGFSRIVASVEAGFGIIMTAPLVIG